MREMIAQRFPLSVGRRFLRRCNGRTLAFAQNCSFHGTAQRPVHAAFDDQIFQIALKEYRELEAKHNSSPGAKAYGNKKKIYDVSTDNIAQYAAQVAGDTRRAAVLALSMALASDKQVCASASGGKFIVDLVTTVTAADNAHQRENVYVAARVALGAATVLLANRGLDEPQRRQLQDFCGAALELGCSERGAATLASNALEGSTLVYLCKTLTLVERARAARHVASLAETLALAADRQLEAHNFATCLGYLQPLLGAELRRLLYGAAERVDLARLDPPLAMILAFFFRHLLPAGVVPRNGAAWLDYLLARGEDMELWCVTEVLELCVRCGALDDGGGAGGGAGAGGVGGAGREAAVLELLRRVIETRGADATANTIASFMLSLLSQGRRRRATATTATASSSSPSPADGGGERWLALARLCADSLLPRCSGSSGEVDGAPCHHATVSTLLWALVTLDACPPPLYLAWIAVAMDGAERLTFFQLSRVLYAFAAGRRTLPTPCVVEARQRLARGVGRVALGRAGEWMAGVERQAVGNVAGMCASLTSLGVLYPPAARAAAEWLLRTQAIGDDANSWCAVAASCVAMGAPPGDFARPALLHLTAGGGAGLDASTASTLAWVCGPLADVLPEAQAVQCMQIVAAGCGDGGGAGAGAGGGSEDAFPDHLLDNLLVTHCWAGGGGDDERWSLDAATLRRLSARYARLRAAQESSAASRRVLGYVRGALGTEFVVAAAGDAHVDYLPAPALALFSRTLGALVPCRTHLAAWQRCGVERRRRGDLRAVCVLPSANEKYLRSELAVAALADPFLRDDDGDDGRPPPPAISWTLSPRVVAYARALSTLGVHTVLPLSPASFCQWESGAHFADYVRASAAGEPSFEAFCPPWRRRGGDGGDGGVRASTAGPEYF